MINYCVVYSTSEGFGNVDLAMAIPPRSIEDIREIEKQIKEKHVHTDVVVMNIIKLEE